MGFSDRIRARRLELNMTTEDVARIVGVSNATISRWETGAIKNQRRDKIERLAAALQVDPAELMGWSDVAGDVIPQQTYREALAEGGVRILLDASSNLSDKDLQEIAEFIKFKQQRNDRK